MSATSINPLGLSREQFQVFCPECYHFAGTHHSGKCNNMDPADWSQCGCEKTAEEILKENGAL